MARRGRSLAILSIPVLCLLLVGVAAVVRGTGSAAPPLPSTARIYEALAEAVAVLIVATGLLTLAISIWALPRPIPGNARNRRRQRWWITAITFGIAYVLLGLLLARRPNLSARPGGGAAGLLGRNSHLTGGTPQLSAGDWLGFALGAAVVLAVLLLLAWYVFVRRTGTPATAIPDDAVIEGVEAGLEELRSIRDPRTAVIRAYAAMERVFARRGLGRRPHEAPTEYLARLIPGTADRGAAASQLTRAYQLARFSFHRVPPDLKEEAIAALEAMRSTPG
jgi:uncharacterized protein DUF4129